jgi:amidase
MCLPLRAVCSTPSLLVVVALMGCGQSPDAAGPGTGGTTAVDTGKPFRLVETTIPEMQAALASGRVTSRELVLSYLARIAQYEDMLNATAYVSRTALDEADALDAERAGGRTRGTLHGIPVAVKDIIHTTNMPTTGGALALAGMVPPYEATLVTKLKEAGAIIIAKTVLTELANWVTNGMPPNYSTLFGYGMNPYDPRRDPRPATNDGRPVLSTGGSSSGIGTAANLWAASVGTETSGSILSPSNQNMLVGIKPTVGSISRHGVIPITADQDTPGPMARTVADAAILLGAMVGPDVKDPETNRCTPPAGNDYTRHLVRTGLRDARIGIPRAAFYRTIVRPDNGANVGGLGAPQLALMEEAIQILRNEGATVVDPADIPSVVDQTAANNFFTFGICAGMANRKGMDTNCSVVLKYGMKRDFNLWAASLGPTAPIQNLTMLREFNVANRMRNAIKYEQENLDISDEMDLEADRARWRADRDRDIFLAATHGIDEVLMENRLDALLFPGSSSAGIAAKAGYPTVTVPLGFVPNALPGLPDGFSPVDQPFGLGFTGTACSEPRLIELAYAFEQVTRRRAPPPSAP